MDPMESHSAQSTEPEASGVQPAGFWIRLAAYVIDMLILMVPGIASLFIRAEGALLLLLLGLLLYKPVLEAWLGATAGKLALGLKVVPGTMEDNPVEVVNDEGARRSLKPVPARNREGIPFSTSLVRNAFFILANIPSIILQLRMAQEGIPPMDAEAQSAFMEQHAVLQSAAFLFSMLVIVSCVMVAFNPEKRALHDRMADTRVIKEASQ